MLLQQAGRVEGHAYTTHIELAKLYVATARYRDAVTKLDMALKIRTTDSITTYRDAVARLAEASE